MRVRWSARAETDLLRLWVFAADHDVDRADRIELEIRRRADILARFPHLGRRVSEKGLREMSLPNIQYVIKYRLSEHELLILRVHHARENREMP